MELEPGLVTLLKIITTLVVPMAVVPIIFLLSQGDKTEPPGFGEGHEH